MKQTSQMKFEKKIETTCIRPLNVSSQINTEVRA